MTLLKRAEDFYRDNRDLVDDIVATLKGRGAPDHLLDELVHEGAENEGVDSEEASALNNQGHAFQVASLLEGNGVEQGTRLIEECADEAGLGRTPGV